jgi:hypothetical protein
MSIVPKTSMISGRLTAQGRGTDCQGRRPPEGRQRLCGPDRRRGADPTNFNGREHKPQQRSRQSAQNADDAQHRGCKREHNMPFDHVALARKMKLGAASRPVVIGGPVGLREGLAEATGASIDEQYAGSHDWILFFAATRAELEASVPNAEASLESPGTLWIGYLRGSSKRQTDLTRDKGWDAIGDTNLMWLSLISIDEECPRSRCANTVPGRCDKRSDEATIDREANERQSAGRDHPRPVSL